MPGFSFYRDVFGGWRWELLTDDGEVIDSREAFETKHDCVRDARKARASCQPLPSTTHPHGGSRRLDGLGMKAFGSPVL
jgi:uncharacterized protein YegP (UPF0339 family)